MAAAERQRVIIKQINQQTNIKIPTCISTYREVIIQTELHTHFTNRKNIRGEFIARLLRYFRCLAHPQSLPERKANL